MQTLKNRMKKYLHWTTVKKEQKKALLAPFIMRIVKMIILSVENFKNAYI